MGAAVKVPMQVERLEGGRVDPAFAWQFRWLRRKEDGRDVSWVLRFLCGI